MLADPRHLTQLTSGQPDLHGETFDLDVPPSLEPIVIVVMGNSAPAGYGASETPGLPSWRCTSVRPSGQHGQDIKQAFREGLRLGGRCIAVWPEELGDWTSAVPKLLRPIFTRRADMAFCAYCPEARVARRLRFPAAPIRRVLGCGGPFTYGGPIVITRRALDVIPFEANDDGRLFELQLLAQTRHFGLQLAPVCLNQREYQALAASGDRKPPRVLFQTLCALEFLMHRWGLIDCPRFQIPQLAYLSRWMISKD